MSSSNYCFLTRIQISQEAGQVVWYSHLFQNLLVCCDPHSQRLWHSQQSRSRCFSGTLLLFWLSNTCWWFDLWFLCPINILETIKLHILKTIILNIKYISINLFDTLDILNISKSISLQAFFKNLKPQGSLQVVALDMHIPTFFVFPYQGSVGKESAQVRSLGWEDSLEKGMATHSSTLAWRIPRREEPGRLQSMGLQSQTWPCYFYFTFITSTKSEDKLSTKWETTHIRYISWLTS